jgi:signal peptidase II
MRDPLPPVDVFEGRLADESIDRLRGIGPGFHRDDGTVRGGTAMKSPLRAGLIAAFATLVIDQASKLWLLYVLDIGHRGTVKVTPFFDLVLAWNIGISFGLFQNDSVLAQTALMVVKALAVIALAIWMARSRTWLATVALGLIIGGAIGNAIDRVVYGAVVDFALFHVQIGQNTLNWYVFNLADAAIVAGVMALLYDSFMGFPAAKAP